jgi:hypothetical protein
MHVRKADKNWPTMKYSADASILLTDDLAELAWRAIEPVWDGLPLHAPARLSAFMADLTAGQRGLVALDWCQKEIRNGGIKQLLVNTTGGLIPFAIDGFRLIGAHPYAAILEEVAQQLGPKYPVDSATRKRALKDLSSKQRLRIDELEADFLNLLAMPDHDLEQYRGRFVRTHPEDFVRSEGSA